MPAPVPFPGGSRDEMRREGGGGQQQVAHDESSTFLLLFLLLPFPPRGRRLGEAAPGELGGERRKGRGLLRDPGGWR